MSEEVVVMAKVNYMDIHGRTFWQSGSGQRSRLSWEHVDEGTPPTKEEWRLVVEHYDAA